MDVLQNGTGEALIHVGTGDATTLPDQQWLRQDANRCTAGIEFDDFPITP